MRKIQIVGLALVAVFAFSAVAAASAFAESEWLVNSVAPAAQVAVESEGKLLLEDTAVNVLGTEEAVAIECTGTNLGFVGPDATMANSAKEDLLESITVTACKFEGGKHGPCSETLELAATPDNLPWLTEIELIGPAGSEKFYDDIITELSGQTEIGWNVLCLDAFGFNHEDLCHLVLGRPELVTGAGGTVVALFSSTDTNQPAATCTMSELAETGLVDGEITLLTEKAGDTLAIS